jgi:hypothetical protein
MHRREFVRMALLASGAALTHPLFAEPSATKISLTARSVASVPADFIGLSYESRQLGDPSFFSGKNRALVSLFRTLGHEGVLRIGGNTSEYCFFDRNAKTAAAPISADPDKGYTAAPATTITPDAIRNLREFLDATGWKLIYGLNLGKGTPESAAEEAEFVFQTIGPRLIAFQIGNEPDLFPNNGLRPHDWGFEQFATEWERFFRAVRQRVPQARFAGPANAQTKWTVDFAQRFKPDLDLLTQHYYAMGPPTDPSMTIDRLLHSAPSFQQRTLDPLQAIPKGLPIRLAETNSCYSGGKGAVSDTFASALWGADLMFQLARAGWAGINFHGGGKGWYTPIAGSLETGFTARPLYYGMLMFAQAQPETMLALDVNANDPLFSAYAMKSRDGRIRLALFNKDASASKRINFANERARNMSVLKLSAPRIDAISQVTLGNVEVGSGTWHAREVPVLVTRAGEFQIVLPPATAILATLGR